MVKFAKEIDGQVKFVNSDPLEIIEELKTSIEYLQDSYDDARKTIDKMKDETYKDDEFAKLKDENQRLKDEMKYGFSISKEEYDAIGRWMKDWFDRKRNGDTYMGAIGGGFVYKFHPTSIGIIAEVVATDGETYEFRNDI